MSKNIMDEIIEAIGQTPEGKTMLENLKSGSETAPTTSKTSRPMSFPIQRNSIDPTIPPYLREYLGNYSEIEDSACGEPVAWGYPVRAKMGEQLWSEAQQFGQMVFDRGQWFLVTKVLSREEAEAQYGPLVKEEYGPRGGWKYIQFGEILFKNKLLAPKKKK